MENKRDLGTKISTSTSTSILLSTPLRDFQGQFTTLCVGLRQTACSAVYN